MNILHVVGARPNFMKAAPVMEALKMRTNVHQMLVHTGQHYDYNMSEVFFKQLSIPAPDVNLNVGPSSHAKQTAEIMVRFESVVHESGPDWVLVYGDVTSTIAAALVSTKEQIPVAHIEAGLRSYDRTMPEEINRVLTDQISTLLFTPSPDGNENLLKEGIAREKIHFVGNVMIDTLVKLLPSADRSQIIEQLGLHRNHYALLTLHRPSNVDSTEVLTRLLEAVETISHELPVVFPIHPRTRHRMAESQLLHQTENLLLIEPVGYIDFLALQRNAAVVITDSGGIQEETTYLNIPCLTIRSNTERPITVHIGTNTLVGSDVGRLNTEVRRILEGETKIGRIPSLWDGHASERIADILVAS